MHQKDPKDNGMAVR